MWVSDLRCAHGHGFEGFFPSREDFESQRVRGLVACPACGSAEVAAQLNAPRLNLGVAAAPPAGPVPTAAPPSSLREWVALLRARSEDVGTRFAAEARAMHQGRAPERAIRGQASGAEFEALLDDGIAVLPLPDPDALEPTH